MNPSMANGDAILIVDADNLTLKADTQGLQITSIDPIGRLNRVTVTSGLGDSVLVFHCPKVLDSKITVGSFVRVMHKPRVVFATKSSVD